MEKKKKSFEIGRFFGEKKNRPQNCPDPPQKSPPTLLREKLKMKKKNICLRPETKFRKPTLGFGFPRVMGFSPRGFGNFSRMIGKLNHLRKKKSRFPLGGFRLFFLFGGGLAKKKKTNFENQRGFPLLWSCWGGNTAFVLFKETNLRAKNGQEGPPPPHPGKKKKFFWPNEKKFLK